MEAAPPNAAVMLANLKKTFTAHPAEGGETYLQHLWFTVGMSSRFLLVSGVLMTHGLFPFLMTKTGSRMIENIYNIMKSRGAKMHPADAFHYDI